MGKHRRRYLTILGLGVSVIACYQIFSMRAAPDTLNTVPVIATDMHLPHEGQPHGVPSTYDWALNPRVGLGNNPGAFTAMTAWGQVYEDLHGNPATNTRVEIRSLKAYVLSKRDQRWHLLQDGQQIDGAAYREDFANDTHQQPNMRYEPMEAFPLRQVGGIIIIFGRQDEHRSTPATLPGSSPRCKHAWCSTILISPTIVHTPGIS